MKIRADFVTNSSSVSYLVSWSPEMADFIRLKNGRYRGDAKKNRVHDALARDLETHGRRIDVDGTPVYYRKYGFQKKTDCLFDGDSSAEPVDFASLDEERLWAYIRGEYLVNARLAAELKGFGAVQIPRDVPAFREKYCGTVVCEECPRRGTDSCFKVSNG